MSICRSALIVRAYDVKSIVKVSRVTHAILREKDLTLIVGIGIDLVSISRTKKILGQPWGPRFVERVFTPLEIALCSKALKPEEWFAGRFAAKEAAAKALGTGFSNGISPKQVMIIGEN